MTQLPSGFFTLSWSTEPYSFASDGLFASRSPRAFRMAGAFACAAGAVDAVAG